MTTLLASTPPGPRQWLEGAGDPAHTIVVRRAFPEDGTASDVAGIEALMAGATNPERASRAWERAQVACDAVRVLQAARPVVALAPDKHRWLVGMGDAAGVSPDGEARRRGSAGRTLVEAEAGFQTLVAYEAGVLAASRVLRRPVPPPASEAAPGQGGAW